MKSDIVLVQIENPGSDRDSCVFGAHLLGLISVRVSGYRVVTVLVSGAPAGLPALAPADRAAAAVCSPGCRGLGSAAGAAGTPPDDLALQPAHTTQQQIQAA